MLPVCGRAWARPSDPWLCSQTHATSEDEDALSECEPPHDKSNKMAFAPSEDSIQPGSDQFSHCAQAYLCLRWAQWPFCWFCHATAYVYIVAESPNVESESDCGSSGRWFDSGPATYRSLKLIMHIFSIFSVIEKCSCPMFNLLDS